MCNFLYETPPPHLLPLDPLLPSHIMSAELYISDIIRQLIAVDGVHLNDLREEHIHNLTPINNVSTGPSPPQDPEFSFYVGKETPTGAEFSFDDMMTVITSEELYLLYMELSREEFIVKFNKIVYELISRRLEEDRDRNVRDSDNIWMRPNAAFIEWFHENDIEIDDNADPNTDEITRVSRWSEHSIVFHQARTNNIPFIRFISPNIEDDSVMHPYDAGLYVNQTTPNKIYETLLMFATGGRTLNPANFPNINRNNLSQMIRRTNLWLMEKFNLSERVISKYSRVRVGYTIRISVTLTTPQGGPDAMELLDSGHDGISFVDTSGS